MDNAEKLLRKWKQTAPRGGVECSDALAVLEHLGFVVERSGKGHYQAFHRLLIGSDPFPFGSFTVNCHAFGVQGQTHPMAIKDILRAERILIVARENDNDD